MAVNWNEYTKRPIYLTDGIEFVRTVPTPGDNIPYKAYVRTTRGEVLAEWNQKIVFDVQMSGKEITKEKYENGALITALTFSTDYGILDTK